jgi:tripartite-type tricarboxylate transporter receptor subunit TctC
VRSGRLRVLAVGAATCRPALPEISTATKAGFPGYEIYVWWGIVANQAGIRVRQSWKRNGHCGW